MSRSRRRRSRQPSKHVQRHHYLTSREWYNLPSTVGTWSVDERTGGPNDRPKRSLPRPNVLSRWMGLDTPRDVYSRLAASKEEFGGFPSLPRVSQRVFRAPPRVSRPAKRGSFSPLSLLRIFSPKRVVFCVRRKIRKEVLFALGRAGFRGSSPGPYRRTQDSQYKC